MSNKGRPRIDITGKRSGLLEAIRPVCVESRHGWVMWLCYCDCGGETVLPATNIITGQSLSCGCYINNFKHGHSRINSRLYRIWKNMRARCNRKNHPQYKNYGGRGISICKEWDDYSLFMEWANDNGYSDEKQIDRIDNDSGYYPDNCRFTTSSINNLNKRKYKNNRSGFKGISKKSCDRYWTMTVKYNGEKITQYGFATPEDAARARNLVIAKYNIPTKTENLTSATSV